MEEAFNKMGIFDVYMSADGCEEIDKRCKEHFAKESFKTMRDTHLKTDPNSYFNFDDDQAHIYSIGYKEGYEAGWKHCLTVCNAIWNRDDKKKNDIKFGDF